MWMRTPLNIVDLLGQLLPLGHWVPALRGQSWIRIHRHPLDSVNLSLYKILFRYKAVLWESIILLLPTPHLQSLL